MNKIFIALSTAALIGFSSVSIAEDSSTMKEGMPAPGKAGAMGKSMEHGTGMQHHGMYQDDTWMQGMDANNDGMVSRREYTKHHEMMYDKMKKNTKGGVDMKDFGMTQSGQDRPISSDRASN